MVRSCWNYGKTLLKSWQDLVEIMVRSCWNRGKILLKLWQDLGKMFNLSSNNVVQICSFIKPWTVCPNMHEQACQQPCSIWPAQPCSSLSTTLFKLAAIVGQPCSNLSTALFKLASSTMFKPVNKQKQAVWYSGSNWLSIQHRPIMQHEFSITCIARKWWIKLQSKSQHTVCSPVLGEKQIDCWQWLIDYF